MKIVLILFLAISTSSYSMDLVPLLEEKLVLRSLGEVGATVKHEVHNYFHKTLLKTSLSKLGQEYCQLSCECRNKVIGRMSGELVWLHGVAVLLPKEVQKYVAQLMLENDKDAAKIFYEDKPVLEAFELYQMIKKEVGDKPIAYLYKMPEKERADFLSKLNPWYGSYWYPMSTKEQEKIHELDENIQQYFHGRSMRVVDPMHECNRWWMGFFGGFGCCAGIIAGSVVGCATGCAAKDLSIILGIIFGAGPTFTTFMGCALCSIQFEKSREVVL